MAAITWTGYLSGTLAVTVIYFAGVTVYLIIGNRIRRTSMAGEGRKQAGSKVLFALDDQAGSDSEGGTQSPEDDGSAGSRLQSQVHDMVDELQAYIKQAGLNDVGRDDLQASVKMIVEKYPEIKDSPFREGIKNLIAAAVEDHCAYRLSADELAEVWNGD
jgi:hypothetical protein